MTPTLAALKRLRRSVDALDRSLLGLLNRRMGLVAEIAREKRSARLPVYAPEREEALLRGLGRRNRGPLTDAALRAVYREILSASRAVGEPLRVAYFGPQASFTHLAALDRFGSQSALTPVRSVADVFYEVDRRKADYGVVPVENSTEGMVNHTLDMFVDSELKICSETLLPIRHMLMSRTPRIEGVHTVYSHPQVLAQCRRWLDEHVHRARVVEASNSAEAARRAAGERGAAAVGTALAASLYRLRILARGIEDLPGNSTRFLVIAKSWSPRTGRDKTSLMVSLKDSVGALHGMLEPFLSNRINLTSIESRPSRKRAWEYYFFIDCEGHVDDRRVAAAVRQLERVCAFVKFLGSYPAAASLAP